MKKLFCIFLCFILMFSMSAVAFADDVHSSDPNAKPLGDMDFDGKVTASDAREILRGSVGLVSLTGITALYADANSDGTITAADARMALRASVELETLNDWQTSAANADTENNKITAKDARFILRASVELENFGTWLKNY